MQSSGGLGRGALGGRGAFLMGEQLLHGSTAQPAVGDSGRWAEAREGGPALVGSSQPCHTFGPQGAFNKAGARPPSACPGPRWVSHRPASADSRWGVTGFVMAPRHLSEGSLWSQWKDEVEVGFPQAVP